ncbi:MAG: hypothetical protein AAGF57_13305 [Pseudomonadota bacterium]
MQYQSMLYSHNFVGGGGAQIVPGTSVSQNGQGVYDISFGFLTTDADLQASYYNPIGAPYHEEDHFIDELDSRYMSWAFTAMREIFTVQSTWNHSFIDVAKISFSEEATQPDTAEIVIGQAGNDTSGFVYDGFQTSNVSAATYVYDGFNTITGDTHGDIWLNADHYSASSGNIWHID